LRGARYEAYDLSILTRAIRRLRIAPPSALLVSSTFRDLVVWQKARVVVCDVYALTRTFPRHEMFGLTTQMRRASISVVCNIAEGHGRQSRADYRHFVTMARGSVLELEAQTIVAEDLGYLTPAQSTQLQRKTMEVGRMLNGLLRYLT
jgi:four helix bundle protein